mgnify:CR=1 FL=1
MSDAELIDALGGPTRLAALLRLHDQGAVQRVSNWKRRGIPARVRLEHADVLRMPIGADGAPAVPAQEEVRDAAR